LDREIPGGANNPLKERTERKRSSYNILKLQCQEGGEIHHEIFREKERGGGAGEGKVVSSDRKILQK